MFTYPEHYIFFKSLFSLSFLLIFLMESFSYLNKLFFFFLVCLLFSEWTLEQPINSRVGSVSGVQIWNTILLHYISSILGSPILPFKHIKKWKTCLTKNSYFFGDAQSCEEGNRGSFFRMWLLELLSQENFFGKCD